MALEAAPVAKTMPLNNVTHITEVERAALGHWNAGGREGRMKPQSGRAKLSSCPSGSLTWK